MKIVSTDIIVSIRIRQADVISVRFYYSFFFHLADRKELAFFFLSRLNVIRLRAEKKNGNRIFPKEDMCSMRCVHLEISFALAVWSIEKKGNRCWWSICVSICLFLAARCYDDRWITRFGDVYHRPERMRNSPCRKKKKTNRERERERGNYFCTSGYTRDDIRAAVLFADNLSRRDIHRTIISTVLLNSHQHVWRRRCSYCYRQWIR